MKLVNFATTLSCLLLLSACKDFTGGTAVEREITLVEKHQNTEIEPGRYSGKLKIHSKKKIVLEMQLPSGKSEFIFKTEQNLKNMSPGDRIIIPAGVSGQSYAVDGVYNVDYSSSQPHSGTESCTFTAREYRCREVRQPEKCETVTECDPANPSQCATRTRCHDGGARTACGYENVSFPGNREVEYTYDTTVESVSLSLYDADQKPVAIFQGSDTDTDKNYIHQGVCQ